MNVSVTTSGKELTAVLKGEIDHHTAGRMREIIDGEIERHKPSRVMLDFSGITFMDSSGIGLIMGRYRIVSLLGGELRVVSVPEHLRRMIQLSGIASLGVLKEDWSVKV